MREMHNQYRICPSASFTSQLLNAILMKISVGVSNELKKGVFKVITQVLTKIKSSGAWHRGDW